MFRSKATASFEPALRSRPLTSFHQAILKKICVQSPYNRLQDLAPWGQEGVQAYVTFESPVGLEAGELASAEIGRHLAILGSCALARNNSSEQRHYYLAHRALLRRFDGVPIRSGEPLRLVAVPAAKDKAEVELRNHREEVVASLTVDYRIVADRLFARIFRNHFQEATRSIDGPSPFGSPIPFEAGTQTEDSAEAFLSQVTPELCAGHFPGHPALPVAILMDGINRLACSHLEATLSEEFFLTTCAVKAEQLAFAGESLRFTARRMFDNSQSAIYHGQVTRVSDGTVFGEAALSYELSAPSRYVPGESGIMRINKLDE